MLAEVNADGGKENEAPGCSSQSSLELGNKQKKESEENFKSEQPLSSPTTMATTDEVGVRELSLSTSPKRSKKLGKASTNSKPFSDSARKRESVQALGSISHLQKFYNSHGLASKKKPTGGGVLAIGHAGERVLEAEVETSGRDSALAALQAGKAKDIKVEMNGDEDHEDEDDNDGSTDDEPLKPEELQRSRYKKPLPYPDVGKQLDADPQILRPGVLAALDETCQNWGLMELIKTAGEVEEAAAAAAQSSLSRGSGVRASLGQQQQESADSSVDVEALLQSTSDTIRKVRTYLFALPADAILPRGAGAAVSSREGALGPSGRTLKPKDSFKRQSSFIGLPRGTGSSSGMPSAWKSRPEIPFAIAKPSGLNQAEPFETLAAQRRRSSMSTGSDKQVNRTASLSTLPSSKDGQGAPESFSTQRQQQEQTTLTPDPNDPLVLIRTASLSLLGALRDLEERTRVASNGNPMSASKSLEVKRNVAALSASFTSPSTLSVNSTGSSTDLPSTLASSVGSAEEEIVVPRKRVPLSSLRAERETVKEYLTTVSNVLAMVSNGMGRTARRRASLAPRQRSLGRSMGLGPSPSPMAARLGRRVQSASVGHTPASEIEHVMGQDVLGMNGAVSIDDSIDEGDADLGGEAEQRLWARSEQSYPGGALARVRDLLNDVLPAELASQLPSLEEENPMFPYEQKEEDDEEFDYPSSGRFAFLNALSNGQLLCLAYYEALRQSKRPWGFIQPQDIHDMMTYERMAREARESRSLQERLAEKLEREERRKRGETAAVAGSGGAAGSIGWTFRRAENLRVWTAALRLRYLLTFASTSRQQGSAGVSRRLSSYSYGSVSNTSKEDVAAIEPPRSSSMPPPAPVFDAKVVARRQAGTPWMSMLEEALCRWAQAVVEEELEVDLQ